MHCEEVQESVSTCFDEGKAFGREVQRHLVGCPTCAAFERDWRRLDTLLKAGCPDAPQALSRHRFAWAVGGCGLVAASVLLAVLATLPWGSTPSRPRTDPFAGTLPTIDADVLDLTDRAILAAQSGVTDYCQQELAYIVAEVRSAADLLLSYVPSPEVPPQANTSPSPGTSRDKPVNVDGANLAPL